MNRVARVIAGLTILNTYEGCEICVGHDVLNAGPNLPVSEEDTKKLTDLGWFLNTKEESWSFYV